MANPVTKPPQTEFEMQAARRRRRSIALGLALGAAVLLFYVLTLVKLGPGVMNRPL